MKFAIIRIRGPINLSNDIKKALELLGLKKKNCCVILEESPSLKGTLNKVKHCITWGEINEETKTILEKRSKKNKAYCLSSPKKGLAKKGIKISFSIGGATGYRGEKINDLIQRML